MAANTTPIFPLTPFNASTQLANANGAAITSGIKLVGAAPTGLVPLVPVTTNGVRIDKITVNVAGTAVGLNAASQVWVWLHDTAAQNTSTAANTATVYDELLVPAVTSTASTVRGATVSQSYTNLTLSPTQSLWVSTTVTPTDVSGLLTITANGGAY
jgi:hypothetical protein